MTQSFKTLLLLAALINLISSCKKEQESSSETDSPTIVQPPPTTESPNVLLVVTSNDKLKDGSSAGYFLPEAIDFYKALKAAGYQVTIASPAGGKAPMYNRMTYEFQYQTYLDTSGLLAKLDNTLTLSTVKANQFKAVCYVGGFACLFDFSENADIKRLTSGIYEAGGIVAAVCHAPAALLNVKLSNGELLIKNKKVTARSYAEETSGGLLSKEDILYYFPFVLEEELKQQNALYSNVAIGKPYAVTDGRLVTGQNPESTAKVATQVVNLLKQ